MVGYMGRGFLIKNPSGAVTPKGVNSHKPTKGKVYI